MAAASFRSEKFQTSSTFAFVCFSVFHKQNGRRKIIIIIKIQKNINWNEIKADLLRQSEGAIETLADNGGRLLHLGVVDDLVVEAAQGNLRERKRVGLCDMFEKTKTEKEKKRGKDTSERKE